jgi:hypothetical protein
VINIRTKGASGEREVATMLNGIIAQVMTAMGYAGDEIEAAAKCVQRNQNQTAVGGCDLTNVFGIAVEVKRQEQVSLGSWWAQCEKSARANNELPLLIWRQNRKPWRVRTYAWLALPGGGPGQYNRQKMIVADFDVDTFKAWFAEWVRSRLEQGWEVRT